MRIAYLLLFFLAVVNLLMYTVGQAIGVNIYKTYGKQILKGFWNFLLLVLAIYVAFTIGGLI